jgi:DNA-binding transcriptional MerR regulator
VATERLTLASLREELRQEMRGIEDGLTNMHHARERAIGAELRELRVRLDQQERRPEVVSPDAVLELKHRSEDARLGLLDCMHRLSALEERIARLEERIARLEEPWYRRLGLGRPKLERPPAAWSAAKVARAKGVVLALLTAILARLGLELGPELSGWLQPVSEALATAAVIGAYSAHKWIEERTPPNGA